MRVDHPYLDNVKPIAFAHRGGTSGVAENSMRAFQDAVDLGFTYVETDVHATLDGVLVAFHDNDLQRTCGQNIRIAETNWADLRSARIDGTEPIPLLEDILNTWPHLRVNIDCKADTALAPLLHILKSKDVLNRVCIGSFSDKRLRVVRKEFGTAVCTSMGPQEVAKLVLGTHLRIPISPSDTALVAQIPVSQGPLPVVTQRTVARAHRLGMQVHVWTIDDPQEIASLLDLGVDGIMSDDTRALRGVFESRGLW